MPFRSPIPSTEVSTCVAPTRHIRPYRVRQFDYLYTGFERLFLSCKLTLIARAMLDIRESLTQYALAMAQPVSL